jgi:hypothetical protein
MIKTMFVGLLAMLSIPNSWAEDEMYLEGISVLGKDKSAYLSMKGGKIQVHVGERVGSWKVARIEERSVFLTTDKGESTELPLYSRLPVSNNQENENEESPEVGDKGVVDKKEEERPPVSNAPEVPPGYRKVHTPFGDFVVKEEEATKITLSKNPSPVQDKATSVDNSSASPAASPPSDNSPKKAEEIPPGYHKVQTPFGDFIMKDKEVKEVKEPTKEEVAKEPTKEVKRKEPEKSTQK